MDICILSMQEVNNMGSLLQSYALKKKFWKKWATIYSFWK